MARLPVSLDADIGLFDHQGIGAQLGRDLPCERFGGHGVDPAFLGFCVFTIRIIGKAKPVSHYSREGILFPQTKNNQNPLHLETAA